MGGGIYIPLPPSCDGIVSAASLSANRHFPSGSHLRSILYHFVFSALTCSPVALDAPAKILSPFELVLPSLPEGCLVRVPLV